MWYIAQFDTGYLVAHPMRPRRMKRLRRIPTNQEMKGVNETPESEKRQCYIGRDGLFYSTNQLRPISWAYGGHRGINSTARRMKKFVWWPNLHHEVKRFVQACLPCTRNRAPVRASTTMVLTKPNPFELVSVDFVGPRSVWGQGWQYVVLIDHCSRFVVTKAVQSANGDSAIQALRELWSPVFGAPRAVLSDNGEAFQSKRFRDYVTGDLAAHLIYSSPYYPQANYH
eukprot:GHVN01041652.1.p1 GENE.GHVN01041652.1~~GHVN01041652.1.p1  ORF type:complete len:227 (-),score=19.31 GHVN01041652.1:197-877(-)